MMTLDQFMKEQMEDPEFASVYKELQTEISKLERGTRNPSIKLLQRLADGMDMVLNISFSPKNAAPPK